MKIPPEVNRILYAKNLPFKVTGQELYSIFGKYGAIRQIRMGSTNESRGTAYVVYEDLFDAKSALEALQGYSIQGRYLVLVYFKKERLEKSEALKKQREAINELKRQYGLKEGKGSEP
ncbi:hypothetical protein MHBO_003160 [Bonamia ostreae]|uniref:RRM domain-containing protein n=1 Tax=Bonamia ostreae TaxID=126728 RepID=A0ABV2APP3_9EUKA